MNQIIQTNPIQVTNNTWPAPGKGMNVRLTVLNNGLNPNRVPMATGDVNFSITSLPNVPLDFKAQGVKINATNCEGYITLTDNVDLELTFAPGEYKQFPIAGFYAIQQTFDLIFYGPSTDVCVVDFMNYPVEYSNFTPSSAPDGSTVGAITYADHSATTTGASQYILPSNNFRKYVLITSVESDVLWVNTSGQAAAPGYGNGSFPIYPGGSYEINYNPSNSSIAVYCVTAGLGFTVKEGQ